MQVLRHKNKIEVGTIDMCCTNGKMRLPVLQVSTPELFVHVIGTTPELKHFLHNIR